MVTLEPADDVDDEQDEDGEDEDAGEGFVDDDLFAHDRSMPMSAQGPAHIAEYVRPVCDGFAWIGQAINHCDDCGHPAWDHGGMKRLRKDAGPFGGCNDDAWEPWADDLVANWLQHGIIDRQRAVALLSHDGQTGGEK